jgi:Zn-dependent M28 family amino/carboxypeptidase
MSNLADLQQIADENNGNRAFGLSGFDASRDYIVDTVSKSEKFDSWTQDFPALFVNTTSIDFTVGGTSYYIYGLTYSPSTDDAGIDAELVLGPSGEDGCSADGYANLDVTDKIVLVQRYRCPTGGTLAGRVRPAAAAGAAAVIVYNDVEPKVTGGTLSAPDPDEFVPAGFINLADGEALVELLESGETLEAHFQISQLIEEQITQNVFAETKGGDSENVIILGAHLDSVQAGPGVNDDGSGTSLLLELFKGLENYDVKNKVRFAWWGAEENGLVGSTYYTDNVTPEEANSILLYLNFDMVSRGYFGVFDGDGSTHGLAGAPGSEVIEKLFVDHLEAQGINVTAAVFTGGSDYATFMSSLEKPVGGMHTGTGVDQDPCYHQECDTYENANSTVLTINAKAAAHVLATLAIDGAELIPKAPSNVTRLAKRGAGISSMELFPWTQIEGERHLHSMGTCRHDE